MHVCSSATSEQSTSINSPRNLTVGTLVRASAQGFAQLIPVISLRTHERTSLRAGEDSLRPRTQRTYKYHANVHPLQGVTPCGSPQAVMIHNFLVGCRNLRSSLEEVDSLLTPDKTSGTSAVWGYEIAQSISLEEVD